MKKLYDHMLKIVIAITQKRHEDESSLDVDVRFLLSLAKYVSSKNHNGSYFLPADEVAQFVNDDVKPHFKMRTESFGRKWDKESLITRGYTYARDDTGKLVHKRGWLIDVKRLTHRVAKYSRFLPTAEQLDGKKLKEC